MISFILSILALAAGLSSLAAVLVYIRRNRTSHGVIMNYLKKITEKQESLSGRIEEVASDITPNFEAAKAAISQVNDLSMGLTNLFNYDPADALRASRAESRGEGR